MSELQKEGLAKLRYVLQEIRKGNLEHKQDSWHCGTAHCVYGWIGVMEAVSKIPLEKLQKIEIPDDQSGYFHKKKYHFPMGVNTVLDWCSQYEIVEADCKSFSLQFADIKIGKLLESIYTGSATIHEQFVGLEKLEEYILGEIQIVDYNPFLQSKESAEVIKKNEEDFNLMMEALSENKECQLEEIKLEAACGK